tara:strand:- start:562 stop:918 length:357 start_codon:yes stop_codon:yes gene_type:complete
VNYFSPEEFMCQHCQQQGIKQDIVDVLNIMRRECGFPFIVTSGYRCPEHPIEAKKSKPGSHADGYAVDIGVRGEQALRVIRSAMEHGIKRIGVNQKGNGRFIHLDVDPNRVSPAIWSY